ncbi:hypothetical protein EVAR_79601_1 [Eumeta japonica]|uniref:Uncharacterized protein n=1 Tax=Eumeta variegata TaxID=151549 RepID=A0A4C1UFR1_EUMVA|nr:hypothetical protein EVAR_79601_1 [Eumeta japonica]
MGGARRAQSGTPRQLTDRRASRPSLPRTGRASLDAAARRSDALIGGDVTYLHGERLRGARCGGKRRKG